MEMKPSYSIKLFLGVALFACGGEQKVQIKQPEPIESVFQMGEKAEGRNQQPAAPKAEAHRTVKDLDAVREQLKCEVRREQIEAEYQNALSSMTHTRCSKDNDCIALPAATQCSNRTCLSAVSPLNRSFAKVVKAIQYQVDASKCPSLTRQCAKSLYEKRLVATCERSSAPFVCNKGRCEVKNDTEQGMHVW